MRNIKQYSLPPTSTMDFNSSNSLRGELDKRFHHSIKNFY